MEEEPRFTFLEELFEYGLISFEEIDFLEEEPGFTFLEELFEYGLISFDEIDFLEELFEDGLITVDNIFS